MGEIFPKTEKWSATRHLAMTKAIGFPQDLYGYDLLHTRRDYVSASVA